LKGTGTLKNRETKKTRGKKGNLIGRGKEGKKSDINNLTRGNSFRMGWWGDEEKNIPAGSGK